MDGGVWCSRFFDLSCNYIDDRCQSFVPQYIKRLSLEHNNLGDRGVELLCSQIEASAHLMTRLSLGDQSVQDPKIGRLFGETLVNN